MTNLCRVNLQVPEDRRGDISRVAYNDDEARIREEIDAPSVHLTVGLKLLMTNPDNDPEIAKASDTLRDKTMAVLRVAFLSSTVLELFSALGVAMIAVWVGFALLGEISWGTWGTPLDPFAGIYLLLLAPDFFQPLRRNFLLPFPV